jgi:hypothetical protein
MRCCTDGDAMPLSIVARWSCCVEVRPAGVVGGGVLSRACSVLLCRLWTTLCSRPRRRTASCSTLSTWPRSRTRRTMPPSGAGSSRRSRRRQRRRRSCRQRWAAGALRDWPFALLGQPLTVAIPLSGIFVGELSVIGVRAGNSIALVASSRVQCSLCSWSSCGTSQPVIWRYSLLTIAPFPYRSCCHARRACAPWTASAAPRRRRPPAGGPHAAGGGVGAAGAAAWATLATALTATRRCPLRLARTSQ